MLRVVETVKAVLQMVVYRLGDKILLSEIRIVVCRLTQSVDDEELVIAINRILMWAAGVSGCEGEEIIQPRAHHGSFLAEIRPLLFAPPVCVSGQNEFAAD